MYIQGRYLRALGAIVHTPIQGLVPPPPEKAEMTPWPYHVML